MKKLHTWSLALALVMLVSPVAIADNMDDPDQQALEAAPTESLDAIVSRPVANAFSMASTVSDDDLAESRGTFMPVELASNLGATNSNNIVIGGSTGSNSVSGDAFNNTSGLVNLIQNSGNNVIIQSATVLNVTLQQ